MDKITERVKFDEQTDKLVALLKFAHHANFVTDNKLWIEYAPHIDAVVLSYYRDGYNHGIGDDVFIEQFYIDAPYGLNLNDAYAEIQKFIDKFRKPVSE